MAHPVAGQRELTKVLELIDWACEAYRATGLLLDAGALALITPFQDEVVLPAAKQAFLEASRQTARRQRRGLWLRVAMLLLLVGLGIGSVFGWRLYQSSKPLQWGKTKAEDEARRVENAARRAEEQRSRV
jgi:hypothetical protein